MAPRSGPALCCYLAVRQAKRCERSAVTEAAEIAVLDYDEAGYPEWMCKADLQREPILVAERGRLAWVYALVTLLAWSREPSDGE